MSSNRLILIFLGIIFLIIVILTSSRIAGTLRQKFSAFLPSMSVTTLTPTPTVTQKTFTPTPTPARQTGGTATANSTPNGEIPATGTSDWIWLLLGGSLLVGISLNRLSFNSSEKRI